MGQLLVVGWDLLPHIWIKMGTIGGGWDSEEVRLGLVWVEEVSLLLIWESCLLLVWESCLLAKLAISSNIPRIASRDHFQ